MQDAMTCPACGVNADTCRCDLRWAHTSAMVTADDQAGARANMAAFLDVRRDGFYFLDGWELQFWWRREYPAPPDAAFTFADAGRLTLRTP